MGIEPTYAAWEAAVLPLNYARSRGVIAWLGWLRKASIFYANAPHGSSGNETAKGLRYDENYAELGSGSDRAMDRGMSAR